MKHRGIEYSVEEGEPGKWRWIIYLKLAAGPKVVGEAKYRTLEEALDGAIEEINNGFERSRKPAPRP